MVWVFQTATTKQLREKKKEECGTAARGLFPVLVSRGSRLKNPPQTKRCTDYMSETSQRRNYFPQLDLNTHPAPFSLLPAPPDPTTTPFCPAVVPKVKVLAADSQVSKRLYKSVGSVLSLLATWCHRSPWGIKTFCQLPGKSVVVETERRGWGWGVWGV